MLIKYVLECDKFSLRKNPRKHKKYITFCAFSHRILECINLSTMYNNRCLFHQAPMHTMEISPTMNSIVEVVEEKI